MPVSTTPDTYADGLDGVALDRVGVLTVTTLGGLITAASLNTYTLTAVSASIGFTGRSATLTATQDAPISMGAPSTVLTAAAISGAGFAAWPDSNFGVLSNGDGTYTFFASNGGLHGNPNNGSPGRSIGTLANPLATSHLIAAIANKQTTPDATPPFDYQGGGPTYRDPVTSRLICFTHCEKGIVPDGTLFNQWYSWISVSTSTDNGTTWTDCGPIITPWKSLADMQALYNVYGKGDHSQYVCNVGEAPFLLVGPYVYVYYHNVDGDILQFGLNSIPGKCVARALVSDVVTAAASATQPVWHKYSGSGQWTELGIRGKGVPVISPSDPNDYLIGMGRNSYRQRYIAIYFTYTSRPLYTFTYRESVDGVTWSAMRLIPGAPTLNDTTSFQPYLTLLDDDNPDSTDPTVTGATFYLYVKNWPSANEDRYPVTVTAAAANSYTLTATAAQIGFTGIAATLTTTAVPPGIHETWPTPHAVTYPWVINGDQTWTCISSPSPVFFGTWGVVNHAAVVTGSDTHTAAPTWARCETALNTADHEVSCRIGPDPNEGFGPSSLGPCARFAAAASTFYYLAREYGTNLLRFGKCVVGVLTDLGSTGVTAAVNDLVTLRVTGTSPAVLTAYKNSVQAGAPVTDAASPITGNVRGGIFNYISRYHVQHGVHDWSAVDVMLGTAYTLTATPAGIGFTGYPINLVYTASGGPPTYQPHTAALNRGSWRGSWRGTYAGVG